MYLLLLLISLLKYCTCTVPQILKYLVHSTEPEAAGALCIRAALNNPQTFVTRIPFEVSSNCEKKNVIILFKSQLPQVKTRIRNNCLITKSQSVATVLLHWQNNNGKQNVGVLAGRFFFFSFLPLLFFLPQNMKQKINRTEELHWMLWRETEDQSSYKRPGLTGWEKRGYYHFFTLLLQLYDI